MFGPITERMLKTVLAGYSTDTFHLLETENFRTDLDALDAALERKGSSVRSSQFNIAMVTIADPNQAAKFGVAAVQIHGIFENPTLQQCDMMQLDLWERPEGTYDTAANQLINLATVKQDNGTDQG